MGQTISQPFIVALMTDLLDLAPTDRVLEIGTGMGYQSALLARLARRVYSMELIEELAQQAAQRLARQGHRNVEIRIGIPPALLYQLKPGGKMVIPAGLQDAQQLILVDKDADGLVSTREILPVQFSALEDEEALG